MAIDIKMLRAQLAAKPLEVENKRPSGPNSRALVAIWIADQKKHRKTTFKGVSGRFPSQSELLAHLSKELCSGQHSKAVIAREARIAPQTLAYLIHAGKVQWTPRVEDAALSMRYDPMTYSGQARAR